MPYRYLLLAWLVSLPATADIEITIRSPGSGNSTVTSNGSVARMDGGGQPGYVLIDLASGAMQMVDDRQRRVMQMNVPASKPVATPRPDAAVRLEDRGQGPKIAGYSTRQYVVSANGRQCATLFGSGAVLELPGVVGIFEALTRMQQQAQGLMGAFRGQRDACEQARLEMSMQFKRSGAPLRLIDANGQLESEVVAIRKDVSKTASFYRAPADYPVTDVQQQMHEAHQQQRQMMQQMQDSMPDMQHMMEQMQQQGGLPPEAMEQMRNMQQLLQQQMQGQ